MTLLRSEPQITLKRPPTAIEKWGAAMQSVSDGVGINPAAERLQHDYFLKDAMDANDFLENYLNERSQPTQVSWGERIPVGQDPIFPMSQEEFREYVLQRLDEKYGPRPVSPRGSGGPSLFPIRGV
jgi:hypothetical protein